MVENHQLLNGFIGNFFELERYLQPDSQKLNDEEINAVFEKPDMGSDREFMDRLLDDPEAIEMIVDMKTAAETDQAEIQSNILSFEEIRKTHPTARPVKSADQYELKKVAASHNLLNSGEERELQLEDDQLKGFIQLVAFKQDQYMVSGHFTIKVPHMSLRLIFPDGSTVEEFEIEEGVMLFRTIVSYKIVLRDICYELY